MITLKELKSNIERQTLLEKTDEWFPVNDDYKFADKFAIHSMYYQKATLADRKVLHN